MILLFTREEEKIVLVKMNLFANNNNTQPKLANSPPVNLFASNSAQTAGQGQANPPNLHPSSQPQTSTQNIGGGSIQNNSQPINNIPPAGTSPSN